MAKVTIDTISKYTGLSRGTVSRALNNRSDISEATRQRVLEACRQFKYVPNPAARALATGRGYAIAVFVANLCGAAQRGVLQGILDTARDGGYTVQLTSVLGDAQSVALALRSAMNERIDAAFALAPLPTELLDEVGGLLGPRPFAHLTESTPMGDAWLFDEVESGALAARHVLSRGVSSGGDLLYVHDDRADSDGRRRRGFASTCEREGLRPMIADVNHTPPEGTDGNWNEVREALRHVRAVATSDDMTALRVMMLAQQVGRAVGQDLQLVGQGNELFAESLTPALSSVDFGGEEIGRRGTEALLQRVRGERQDGPVETRVAPRLVVRGSSEAR
ncbi:MAG: LacI family DNA-binding transcriptional regulator [Phycisphaerae bacterium]|nr:LacI family DNA-binding transcriptional regulator [Phycisphaerae bacterium]